MVRSCIIIFSLVFSVSVFGQQLPMELVKVARNNDCKEIDNFFNRPGMVEPSYIYGYIGRDKRSSAVLWCQSTEEKRKYFLLVYVRSGKPSGCREIITTTNYPGGLSLFKDSKLSLSKFKYVNNNNKSGPDVSELLGNFIMSYYDGVETIYYCYEGKWLRKIRH